MRPIAKALPLALSLPLLIAAASSAEGQVARGTLIGTVTDARGGLLQGAQITVSPGSATAISNQEGQYTLIALPAGSYTVSVKYAGFAPFSQAISISSGQPVRLDASLQVASENQAVDVYAGREGGEVEAIKRTFSADNIINVLPAHVITSLPNANVADAIGRLASVTLERDEGEGKYVQVRGTEPRLTNTTVDGVNIAFEDFPKLSSIPRIV